MQTSTATEAGETVSAQMESVQSEEEQTRWQLEINGEIIKTRDELVEIAKEIEDEIKEIDISLIWDARSNYDPDSKIDDLIDRHPVLVSMCEYTKEVIKDGIILSELAESDRSISDIIIKATAGVLLRDGLADNFEYQETGELIINSQNPPSLERGTELLKRILEVRETGKRIENYSAWTLGMISDQLENFFGERFDPTMVMGATGASYNTYTTSINVFRNCWANRKHNLSFTHHKEVYYSNIDDDHKELALDLSSKLSLSVALQRKLLSYIRVYGPEAVQEDEFEDADDLMQKISVRSTNKNFMFFVPSQNKWFKYRGPYERIPQNASTVFNLDTKTMVSESGPIQLDDWDAPVDTPQEDES